MPREGRARRRSRTIWPDGRQLCRRLSRLVLAGAKPVVAARFSNPVGFVTGIGPALRRGVRAGPITGVSRGWTSYLLVVTTPTAAGPGLGAASSAAVATGGLGGILLTCAHRLLDLVTQLL